jgi:hypothetical protein
LRFWGAEWAGFERRIGGLVDLSPEGIDGELHGVALVRNGADEFELGTASIEIVFGAMDAEVFIAGEEIGKETQADGEADDLAGEDEMPAFGVGEERGGGFEVTVGEGFEHGEMRLDFGEVLFVFECWTGGGAHHVAEVIEDEAGHDGIEVEDAEGFAGFPIEHDVIELGIVVRDALGQVAAFECVGEGIDDGFLFGGEVDLGRGGGGAIVGVGLDGLEEGIEATSGVVEMRDGFEQAFAWEIDEEMLKAAEGAAGFEGLARGLDGFEGLSAFDEDEGAPEVAGAVAVVGVAVAGGDDGEGFARDVAGAFGFESMTEVRGDAHDVVHDGEGFMEYGLVDFLVDITDQVAALVVGGHVGLVDVPDLAGFGVEDIAVDLELARDFLQVFFLIDGHSRDELQCSRHGGKKCGVGQRQKSEGTATGG